MTTDYPPLDLPPGALPKGPGIVIPRSDGHSMRIEKPSERARRMTDEIRSDLTQAASHFMTAGEKLEQAFNQEIWKDLGYPNWSSYCEKELEISDALCYDLIRIVHLRDQFPRLAPTMLARGISKVRLLLGGLKEDKETHTFEADEPMIAGMLEEAKKPWRELRRTLHESERGGGEREEHPYSWVECACPACGVMLELSRAAQVRVK